MSDNMQKLIYPMQTMGITQNYNSKYSHYYESHAKDYECYPIDDGGKDNGRDWFYAPCDLVIKRVYGVGVKGTNTLWLESLEKIKLANGEESFITIRITHPNDDDLSRFKVGQKFKQYEKIIREGTDGHATGNHLHFCINKCKFKELYNNGWIKNSNNYWVTAPKALKPEDSYFIDTNFTKIKNNAGLNFKKLTTDNKKRLYLPSDAQRWRVYPLGVPARVGNEKGFLTPSNFDGLDYEILEMVSKNVAIINTKTFGKVQIYVAPSTGAVIK